MKFQQIRSLDSFPKKMDLHHILAPKTRRYSGANMQPDQSSRKSGKKTTTSKRINCRLGRYNNMLPHPICWLFMFIGYYKPLKWPEIESWHHFGAPFWDPRCLGSCFIRIPGLSSIYLFHVWRIRFLQQDSKRSFVFSIPKDSPKFQWWR